MEPIISISCAITPEKSYQQRFYISAAAVVTRVFVFSQFTTAIIEDQSTPTKQACHNVGLSLFRIVQQQHASISFGIDSISHRAHFDPGNRHDE